jgi:hypothetical protein
MSQDRRTFLRILGAGSALYATSAAAQPHRPRLLEGSGARDIVAGVESPEMTRAVGALRLGTISRHEGLAVVYLHSDLGPALSITTLDEARGRGELTISERGQATVPELIVDNKLGTPVLLLAGEILTGGKQNRVVTEDILLPPHSGERPLGVYCVEQGRWASSGGGFRSSGAVAGAALRSRIMAKSDQASVWSAVRQYEASARVSSATRSYTAVTGSSAVERRRAEVERHIEGRAPSGALGVAIFHGGTMLGLDVFSDTSLFARQWPKLLRAAIVDTLATPATTAAPDDVLRDTVQARLKAVVSAKGARHGNAGVGTIFEMRSGQHVAAALVFEGRVVHLAVV